MFQDTRVRTFAADNSRAELIRAVEQCATFTYLPFYGHAPEQDGSAGPSCLSQQASGFDQQAWEAGRYGIVVDAGRRKFLEECQKLSRRQTSLSNDRGKGATLNGAMLRDDDGAPVRMTINGMTALCARMDESDGL
jgi:hypothetical protein